MNLRFSTSTKLMAGGILLSMGWFVLASCDCDESKEDKYPGFWVACIGNKPALMSYSGNNATIVSSDPAASFNPAEYDCSHNGSPHYKGSESDAPFKVGSPAGPGGYGRKPHQTAAPTAAFIPHQLRDLPFLPDTPPSQASPNCDSSFPDILQTDHNLPLLTRVSTCPFAIKTVIPVPTIAGNTLQVQVTPDGSTAIATSFGSAVNFIDLATNTVTYTLMTDSSINPDGLAISPDGATAYVTSFNPANPVVLVINIASKQITATLNTIQYPSGATLTPDGSQLWITSPLAQSVDIFDTLSNTRITGLAIAQTVDVAFNSTGTHAYVTSGQTIPGSVYEIDTATFKTTNTYTVGLDPSDIKMSYGDQWLVVNNDSGGSISIIDLLKGTVATTAVGASPTGIAFVH
jgi:hypothetical protein